MVPVRQAVYIKQVAIHEGPHLDEIAAYEILRRYGLGLFPGIDKAGVVFWAHGGETPDGQPAGAWVKRGLLPLGQGFGQFDEHPCPERQIPRKAGQSTTSLVAGTLGFGPRNKSAIGRAVYRLVGWVTEQDLSGNSNSLAIEQALSAMHRTGCSSKQMLEFGLAAVRAVLDDQIAFQEEYDLADPAKKGFGYRYESVGGYLVALVVSSSEQTAKAARARGARLVLRRDPETGHVTIMKKHEAAFSMARIVARLREQESRASGLKPVPELWENEGRVAGWYFHPALALVTTGGNRSARSAKPSVLSWDNIESTVFSVLEPAAEPAATA